MSLLEGRALSKRFARKGVQVEALKDVSFTLGDGEILVHRVLLERLLRLDLQHEEPGGDLPVQLLPGR